MLEHGRRLFWVLAIGLVVLVLVTIRQLPSVVASHFDGAGVPNGWSSRPGYVLLLITIGAGLPIVIVGLVNGLTRRGPDRLNIPARDHWTRPEHRQEAVRRVRAYVWWLGCILALTASAMHGLIVTAHGFEPPRINTVAVLSVLGAVLLAIGAWTVGWYRLLRRPLGR